MSNTDVRTAAKNAGVFLYQIAAAMGISEPTMQESSVLSCLNRRNGLFLKL
ncbi:MAG: hypothetical protein J6A37_06215 [Oscillospiraceae bacterium]|nr:hypothetical protein [Oscillospiraceae bacterium]